MPIRRAPESRGSGGLSTELRVPLPEGSFEFVVKHLGTGLEQEVSAAQGPLHLLLFHEPPADDLIDSRLNERGADSFALPPAISKVGYERFIVLDVGLEVCQSICHLGGRG